MSVGDDRGGTAGAGDVRGGAYLQGLRTQLVPLLQKLGRIPDPRRPRSVRHKLTVLLVYGIFLFILNPWLSPERLCARKPQLRLIL